MEMISRSFRLERGSSLRLARSKSSLLVSELASSDLAKITGYERLSQSMRLTAVDNRRRKSSKAWAFLAKVFSFRTIGADHAIERQAAAAAVEVAEEKKKRRSSWLPDPHRRWPVQGW